MSLITIDLPIKAVESYLTTFDDVVAALDAPDDPFLRAAARLRATISRQQLRRSLDDHTARHDLSRPYHPLRRFHP